MTSTVLQMPTTPGVDLSTRAMIISLTIGSWSARKFDRTATREVAQAHNSDEAMGSYTKKLIGPGSTLDKIHTKQSAARARHYALTLPWANDGGRIISAPAYMPYTADMRKFREDLDDLVFTFGQEYPDLKDEARRKLNGLYNAADYPADIKDKFTFGWNVSPLAAPDDFRVSLGTLEVTRIKAEMQAQADALLANAMKDVWQRMFEPVSRMAEALRAYQPAANGQKAEGIFRDSLVSNLRDVLQAVPLLNITQDQTITHTAKRIEDELTGMSADQLRCSKWDREYTADKADEICSFMAQYIA